MASKVDKELTDLLTKLYTIQEDVGAKPKTTAEDKKNKAEDTASMGKTKATKKKGTRFLELKSSIIERLKRIHELMEEESKRNKGMFSVAAGNNPKEVIARQSEMREEIRQASDEWKELDGIYKNEARKKRSKFSQEDLDLQQTLVQRLHSQIQSVKEAQMKGYARGGTDDLAATLNTKALASLDAAEFGSGSGPKKSNWTGATSDVQVTDGQRVQLQQLQDRDAEFDKQLEDIGEGIQDLSEIAQLQSEEVKRQNAMLENVGNKIDNVHEHLLTVNAKMKETLDEVRAADKICVDIMCIVMMIGLGAVLYQLLKAS